MEFRIDFEGCEAIAVGRDTDEAGPGRTMTGVAGIASGFAAGTEIATTLGWRTVETLQPGDRVLTFDHGSQPVRAVQR
ncbi:MAG: Hint domain-containing protein, partial [Rhodovulum sp.]